MAVSKLCSATNSSNVFCTESTSWSSYVHINFMTNEIPQALARNNGLFSWLQAEWVVVVVVVKTGFQPLQLSWLSLLVLRLAPGSVLHPTDQGDVCHCMYVCVCVCVCVFLPPQEVL